MRWLIAICFVSTGAFALAYEVVWARYLQLFIGHTTQAHTIVLATFMGGQALGYVLFGRLADRAARPVAIYGAIELAIGVYAIGFPSVYASAGPAFLAAAADLPPGGAAILLAKLAAGVLLVLPPAVLMGGTLPLLARSLSAGGGGAGRTIATLYSLNCAGAVAGTLGTAYVLLPGLGQTASMLAVGFANAMVGAVAYLAGAGTGAGTGTGSGSGTGTEVEDEGTPEVIARVATLGAFATGFAAMTYEIAWFRLLAISLGASTYAFAIMLAAFIGGIALGARFAAGGLAASRPPLRLFGWLQVATAAAVALAIPLYELLPNLFRSIAVLLAHTREAFGLFQAAQLLACAGVMLVPTTLGGMGLPVVTRAVARAGRGVGRTVGRSFAANTAGTLAGAVLAGLVLLPALGIRHVFTVGILVNLAAGAAALLASAGPVGAPVRRLAPLGIAAAVGALSFAPGIARGALTFQTFRRATDDAFASFAGFRAAAAQRSKAILYDRDGATCTVTVIGTGGKKILFVNGKPDASTGGDIGIQLLLGHVPMLLKPDAKAVCVVGLGSGMTAGAILRHPVERLDVIEISPEVVEASRLFDEATGAPLDDPRCRVVEEDARIALALSRRRYDVIVSEPSNPWVAGVSSLFTEEHFRTIAARLEPGGLACQWFHLYECSDELVRLVLRTFRRVFPHVRIFADRLRGDLLPLGSLEPREVDLAALAERLARPEVARDLAQERIVEPATLLFLELYGPREARLLAGPGPIHRDDLPALEHAAPLSLFVGDRATAIIDRAEDPGRVPPAGDRLLERWLAGRALRPAEVQNAIEYLTREGSGRWPDVGALLGRAVATFDEPAATEARRHAVGRATREGRLDEAVRLTGPILAAPTATATDFAALADLAIRRRDGDRSRLAPSDYADALAAAGEMVRRFPETPFVGRFYEAVARQRRGEPEPAAAAFAAVLGDEKADRVMRVTAAVQLARIAYARGGDAEAVALCERALELAPDALEAAQLKAAIEAAGRN